MEPNQSIAAASMFIICAFSLNAQGKPNFSGTWKLNTLESDFAMLPSPASRTDIVEHSDPLLKVGTELDGAQSHVAYYTTDGQESRNRAGPLETKSTVVWEESNLVIRSTVDMEGGQAITKSIWTLSGDQHNLIQRIHLQIGTHEVEQKLVFERSEIAGSDASKVPRILSHANCSAKADYSGAWRLAALKSDFGGMPPPDVRIDVIDHCEPVLKIKSSQDGPDGRQEFTTALHTDGRVAASRLGRLDAKSTAAWAGDNLVVETRLIFQGSEITIQTTYLLSEDRTILTELSEMQTASGEIHQKLVFDKQ